LSASANDKRLFIELESRVSVSPLPAPLSDTGATIVGNFNGGGGFYWMPTTGARASVNREPLVVPVVQTRSSHVRIM